VQGSDFFTRFSQPCHGFIRSLDRLNPGAYDQHVGLFLIDEIIPSTGLKLTV
jgi:hypothetical protein